MKITVKQTSRYARTITIDGVDGAQLIDIEPHEPLEDIGVGRTLISPIPSLNRIVIDIMDPLDEGVERVFQKGGIVGARPLSDFIFEMAIVMPSGVNWFEVTPKYMVQLEGDDIAKLIESKQLRMRERK